MSSNDYDIYTLQLKKMVIDGSKKYYLFTQDSKPLVCRICKADRFRVVGVSSNGTDWVNMRCKNNHFKTVHGRMEFGKGKEG